MCLSRHTAYSAVVWFCSDQASFTTSATLPIDGGKLAGIAPFGAPRE
jgi:hypothetical protein